MKFDMLREFHERRPFQPFDIRTTDGRVYFVDEPQFLSQSRSREYVTFVAPDDLQVVIDIQHIESLEVAPTPAA